MKFLKGTFNTVPNKTFLRGKPAEMQAIYFWIVDHANEYGNCFPGRELIAREAGCNIKTVDKYIKQLQQEKFLTKTPRKKIEQKKQASNFYQLLIINPKNGALLSTENGAEQDTEKGAVTKPILTTTQLTSISGETPVEEVKENEPFSFIVELNKLSDGGYSSTGKKLERKDFKIIALYWETKPLVFENQEQFNSALTRDLRAAKALKGYNSREIFTSISYCKNNYDTWTLETVGKRIGDLVNIK